MHLSEIPAEQLVGQLQSAIERRLNVTFVMDQPSISEVLFVAIKHVNGEEVMDIAGVTGEAEKNVAKSVETTSASWVDTIPAGEERELVQKQLTASNGNMKEAIVTLQKTLMKPLLQQGFTVRAASDQLALRYTHIF